MRPIGPGRGRNGHGIRCVADRRNQVQVLEDASEQRSGRLHVERDAHQPHQGHQQPRLHGRECDDRSGGDDVGAAGDEIARDEVDHCRDTRHEHLHDREEPLTAHRPPHLQTHLIDVLGAIPGGLGALPVERLRQQDAGDAQRLLRDGGEFRQRLLRLAGDARPHLTDSPLDDDEDRHHHDRDDRQAPVDDDHRHERGDDRDDVAQDAGDGVGEHARDAAHVVLQAGLDDAGLGTGEEAELHRLQVLEELDAQVSGDPVADSRGEPGLHDTERGRQHEQSDHDQHESQQQRQVGRAPVDREERLIEDLLNDQRGDDGDRGTRDDEDARDEDPEPVRAEQRDHAPAEMRDAGRVGVELLLRFDVDRAESASRPASSSAHAHERKPTDAVRREA